MSLILVNCAKSFCDLLNTLARYCPENENLKIIINAMPTLDLVKLCHIYMKSMECHMSALENGDDSIFENSIIIVPGVDLSELWHEFTSERQNKIRIMLQMLTINCTRVMDEIKLNQEKDQNDDDFNPYLGVGEDNDDYNLDDIQQALDTFQEGDVENGGYGIGSIARVLGLDKLLDSDEVREQLANIKQEDIDGVTQSIQGLFGDMNPNTNKLVNNMLGGIVEELQQSDLSNGKLIDNMHDIAKRVSSKLQPQMESVGVEGQQELEQGMRNMAQNFSNQSGNSNLLSMMQKMMQMIPDSSQERSSSQMSQEEMMKQSMDFINNMYSNNSRTNNSRSNGSRQVNQQQMMQLMQQMQNNPNGSGPTLNRAQRRKQNRNHK